MTVYRHNDNPNSFVRTIRKLYNPLGFKKGYNFTLYFIFAGALLGFALARAMYFDINSTFRNNSGPGEWFFYRKSFYKFGITLHIACVVPAGILTAIQFMPAVRYRAIMVHRINGYILLLLLLLINISALTVARHAFGGTLSTQLFVGVLAIATTTSATMSYINIKRLQIEQHRAWILRCWSLLGTIITVRIIMPLTGIIVGQIGGYYMAVPCKQLSYAGGQGATADYAACIADPNSWTAVEANLSSPNGIAQVIAAFQISFGMAGWLAICLHAIGMEVYLHLTSAETERLREVSYQKQLERGFRHPGRGGLTADRIGDVLEWKSKTNSMEASDIGRASNDIEYATNIACPKPAVVV